MDLDVKVESPSSMGPGREPGDVLTLALEQARHAPSSLNTQPWIFQRVEASVQLRADHTRRLPIADPHGRELIISCGAALFHLRVAIREYGHAVQVLLLPDSLDADRLADVHVDRA